MYDPFREQSGTWTTLDSTTFISGAHVSGTNAMPQPAYFSPEEPKPIGYVREGGRIEPAMRQSLPFSPEKPTARIVTCDQTMYRDSQSGQPRIDLELKLANVSLWELKLLTDRVNNNLPLFQKIPDPMPTKTCSHCQMAHSTEASFCPRCGTPVQSYIDRARDTLTRMADGPPGVVVPSVFDASLSDTFARARREVGIPPEPKYPWPFYAMVWGMILGGLIFGLITAHLLG